MWLGLGENNCVGSGQAGVTVEPELFWGPS